MATRAEPLSNLGRQAQRLWLANAAHEHFGRCGTCQRTHDENGSPLYVARQSRRRSFECLDCWEERTTK